MKVSQVFEIIRNNYPSGRHGMYEALRYVLENRLCQNDVVDFADRLDSIMDYVEKHETRREAMSYADTYMQVLGVGEVKDAVGSEKAERVVGMLEQRWNALKNMKPRLFNDTESTDEDEEVEEEEERGPSIEDQILAHVKFTSRVVQRLSCTMFLHTVAIVGIGLYLFNQSEGADLWLESFKK